MKKFGIPNSAFGLQGFMANIIPQSAFRNLHSKGFTLLEVMVAVVIMGTVIVTLIGLKNRSMQDVLLAEHMTTATMLAKRMMVTAIVKPPSLGEEEGDFADEEAYKNYTWKRSVVRIQISTIPAKFMKEIRIAVLWKEGSRDESVELVSYEKQ